MGFLFSSQMFPTFPNICPTFQFMWYISCCLWICIGLQQKKRYWNLPVFAFSHRFSPFLLFPIFPRQKKHGSKIVNHGSTFYHTLTMVDHDQPQICELAPLSSTVVDNHGQGSSQEWSTMVKALVRNGQPWLTMLLPTMIDYDWQCLNSVLPIMAWLTMLLPSMVDNAASQLVDLHQWLTMLLPAMVDHGWQCFCQPWLPEMPFYKL